MVIVKRYGVRFNGVIYGPGHPAGQIITGLSDEEEARLIAGSGGTIERYFQQPDQGGVPAGTKAEEPKTEKKTAQESRGEKEPGMGKKPGAKKAPPKSKPAQGEKGAGEAHPLIDVKPEDLIKGR